MSSKPVSTEKPRTNTPVTQPKEISRENYMKKDISTAPSKMNPVSNSSSRSSSRKVITSRSSSRSPSRHYHHRHRSSSRSRDPSPPRRSRFDESKPSSSAPPRHFGRVEKLRSEDISNKRDNSNDYSSVFIDLYMLY